MDTPAPDMIGEDATEEKKAAYKIWQDDSVTVKYVMLASMSNELQRHHEGMDVPSILLNLKELYGEQSWTARYEICKQLFHARMSEGMSMQTYVLKMIDLITYLRQLGFAMNGEQSQTLILQSFSKFFSQFVINYHMNKLNTNLLELLNMLKTTKSHFKSKKASILLVDKISKKKTDNKGSNKKKKNES